MDVVRASLRHPSAVAAAVLTVVLFGIVGLVTIPIQLTPDVRRPVLTVRTSWGGAAPADIEREIIIRQEEQLKGVTGVLSIESAARRGYGSITLEFAVGTDMDKAMLLVSNHLDRITGYPDEADEPTIDTAGSDDTPIANLVLMRLPGNDRDMNSYGDFAETEIGDRLNRVPGVARVAIYGGTERELQVVIDPADLAAHHLTVNTVVAALRAANVSGSAGTVDDGKRRYTVRIEGKLTDPKRVREVVLVSDRTGGGTARLTVGDIARVEFGYKRPTMWLRHLGKPAITLSVMAETSANVMKTMAAVRAFIAEANAGVLAKAGLHLGIVYDQTDYVRNAIDLVVSNIYIGGLLAAAILFLFLRSLRATLVISLAIPISTIGTFVGMSLLGRSLNVISLAGLAFAVGMVVDAAIVVLENIFRHREMGYSRARAAELGARQVWMAVLASSVTTVVVFVPLLIMKEEAGQLFRDIAVAISVSIGLSMVVAITVVPVLARRLLGPRVQDAPRLSIPVIDPLAGRFVAALRRVITAVTRTRRAAAATVATMMLACVAATVLLMPKLEYLPEGNRNLAFGGVRPPPGYNIRTTLEIARRIEAATRPLWASETGPEEEKDRPPKIAHFSFNAFDSGYIEVMATAADPSRVAELIPVMRTPLFDEPGTYGFMSQPSLFARSDSSRAIEVNISGERLEDVALVARKAAAAIEDAFPRRAGYQVLPRPGLELGAPEVRLYPDAVRLKDAGLTAGDLANSVDVFNDGLRVAEVSIGNRRVDLTLKGADTQVTSTQGIDKLPVVTADGTIVPAASLARIAVTEGPTEIRHVEGERSITLQVRPPTSVALETVIRSIEEKVRVPLEQNGLPPGVSIDISGVASKLARTWHAMVGQLGISTVVVYLILVVLFENALYPALIMLTLPMASAGALAVLGVVNLFVYTPLDMLTMLGFVILIGVVVNNAILLVHQSLYLFRREGAAMKDAVLTAALTRLRPIFMSTLTSLFGMAPLVLFPGAGTELYRGLGAVVLGGLGLSTFLTLVGIPALMCLCPSGRTGIVQRTEAIIARIRRKAA